jgi:hypothetical protein
LTPYEAEIARALDTAVREDGTLKSFSALPWAEDAKVFGPGNLRYLRACKPSTTIAYKDILVLTWEEPVNDNEPCGGVGFYANLKLKNGQIKFVTFAARQIIVTSANAPKGE